MAIPVYLWLMDDNGKTIKGSVDVRGREGSIEVSELMHSIELPTDTLTGKITAKCLHSSFSFMKEIDSSSPWLYKALSTGQTLKSAVFKFYRINSNGQEEEYFRTSLENIKVTEVDSLMMDVKNTSGPGTIMLSLLIFPIKKLHGIIWTVMSFILIHGTRGMDNGMGI